MKNIIAIVTGNRTVRKATNALGVTFVAGVGAAWMDGNLTFPEIGAAAGVALAACAAVWKTSNGPAS